MTVLLALKVGHASVVKAKVTAPEKPAAGVYVTVEGVAVNAVLLKVPPPDTMDHAALVAGAPKLAPDNTTGAGEQFCVAVSVAPGVIVGAAVTVTCIAVELSVHPPDVTTLLYQVVWVIFADGV